MDRLSFIMNLKWKSNTFIRHLFYAYLRVWFCEPISQMFRFFHLPYSWNVGIVLWM